VQSCEKFKRNLSSNYWQVNKIFWQIIRFLRGKNLILLYLSKPKMVSSSATRGPSFEDGESVSKCFWSLPISYHHTHRKWIRRRKTPPGQNNSS